MGYKPSRKTFNIHYEQFPGLEILTYGMTNDEMLGFRIELDPRAMMGKSKVEQLELLTPFVSKVIKWNLEHPDVFAGNDPRDDIPCPTCGAMPGDEVPVSAEALLCFDTSFLVPLLYGWMKGVAGIDDLKELISNNGKKNGLGQEMTTQIMQELGMQQNPII